MAVLYARGSRLWPIRAYCENVQCDTVRIDYHRCRNLGRGNLRDWPLASGAFWKSRDGPEAGSMDGRGLFVPLRIQSPQVRTMKKRPLDPNQLASPCARLLRRLI